MRMTDATFAQRCLMIVAVVLAVDARLAQAQKPYFPDLIFTPRDKDRNSLDDDMTSVHLEAMKEPSLWKLSQQDRQVQAYRFLWLASGGHPISLRLTRTGGAFALHVAGHDGSPGTTAGRLTFSKDIKLTGPQGEKLVALLAKTTFWTSPAQVKESWGIADGDGIVIEGIRDGKYHVIRRAGLAAGESLKAFCRSLLELAGEPAVLKFWDRYRLEERKMSAYRAEPSQTEDRGDPDPAVEAP